MDVIYAVFGFIVGIGLLIIIHELGHFCAARWFNVRVLRFSIGFGPCKTIWYDRFGTEYVVSAVPLGGYIQLLDTLEDDNNLSVANITNNSIAMDKQSPWVRLIIYLAGPAFSILFAIILYWAVFMIGIKVVVPIVGSIVKGSTADIAKLTPGLEITKINAQPVYDWEDILSKIINEISAKNNFIKLQSYNNKINKYADHILNISGLALKNNKANILKTMGIVPVKLGVSEQLFRIHKYGIIDSFYRSVAKTYNYSILSFRILCDAILKNISLKNLAGPIAIGYYAGQAIKSGLEHFLNFLGLISISLGVLNLMPMPWLDGGSILYCIYEIVTGKKLPIIVINFAKIIGLIILLLLMALVFINDLIRF